MSPVLQEDNKGQGAGKHKRSQSWGEAVSVQCLWADVQCDERDVVLSAADRQRAGDDDDHAVDVWAPDTGQGASVRKNHVSRQTPPLLRGEILVPPRVKELLVRSTTQILGKLVAWDERTSGFLARHDQPDLCLLPMRSGPIAAAGLIAFAQKHQLPVPAFLTTDGLGSEVYLAYERAHCHYEEMWSENPDEYARLRAVDIERYGEERSFLAWIDRNMRDSNGDGFSFSWLYFLDPSFGGDDEIVGGYYRFVESQVSSYALPNAARSAQERARALRP